MKDTEQEGAETPIYVLRCKCRCNTNKPAPKPRPRGWWRRENVALAIYTVGFSTTFACYEFGLIEWSLFTSLSTLVGVFAVIWRYG